MSNLTEAEKKQLLKIAQESIQSGISRHSPCDINEDQMPASLNTLGASFVTLHKNGELRGCIGSLQAHRPLAADVAQNAFNAAFQDPRFPPVTAVEVPSLVLHISVLSESSPMVFSDEEDLLSQIRPHIDGLVLSEGMNRGTFLPSVWEQLPDKQAFLNHLKQKAGLPPHYWSPNIKVERYTVDNIE